MDSPLIARPWTPPETEAEQSPRSDYFSDSFRGGDSAYSSYTEHRWPPNRPEERANTGASHDTSTEDHRFRPKPIATHTEPGPFTPTRSFTADHAHGAPQYPYTPDSSRIPRRNTEVPFSPTPWDDFSEHSSSPVQNALSSCIAHFENLIQTRQPDEDQMEYIVAQFEAMASYLSAPESQTRKTDDHLFTEHDGAGLGISSSEAAQLNEAYVAEVGRYIDGVKKYISDLTMRLDEVKSLNSIQLEVIRDLRKQMKTVRQGMRSSLSMREEVEKAEQDLADNIHNDSSEEEPKQFGLESWETTDSEAPSPSQNHTNEHTESRPLEALHLLDRNKRTPRSPRYKVTTIIHTPESHTLWSSFTDALDSFGDLLLEY